MPPLHLRLAVLLGDLLLSWEPWFRLLSKIPSQKSAPSVLPMAEMVGWLRQGVGALIRQAGLRVMELLMEKAPQPCSPTHFR